MSTLENLELKQLRIFRALLRERNASRVASQIGVTQQAISDQLRKLRNIFDDELFVRKNNGLIPTQFAHELGAKVDKVLNDFERLLEPKVFDPSQLKNTYTIAATDYAQQIILPPLLAEIRKLAPELKLVIQDLNIDVLNDLMVEGRIDLAITTPDLSPNNCPNVKLYTETHVCVASINNPLVGQKLTIHDIASSPQIVTSTNGHILKAFKDEWFNKTGEEINAVITVPCFTVVPNFIQHSDAIAFLPSKFIFSDDLVPLDLEEYIFPFDVIAAWHPRSEKDPLRIWMTELLQKTWERSL